MPKLEEIQDKVDPKKQSITTPVMHINRSTENGEVEEDDLDEGNGVVGGNESDAGGDDGDDDSVNRGGCNGDRNGEPDGDNDDDDDDDDDLEDFLSIVVVVVVVAVVNLIVVFVTEPPLSAAIATDADDDAEAADADAGAAGGGGGGRPAVVVDASSVLPVTLPDTTTPLREDHLSSPLFISLV